MYRNKVISQRIDNDVDTDDEQVNAGVRRMTKILTDAVENQKNMIKEQSSFMTSLDLQ